MLDAIEDENGPVMADRTLQRVGKALNWHATRDDSFVAPIVRGMTRTSVSERARERVLSDDEVRAVWFAADNLGTAYTRMLQFILLTATRLREASNMNRAELNGDGTEWTIPADRHKAKRDFLCPLSQAAQGVIAKLPAKGSNGWVFTTDGSRAISGNSKWKRLIEKEMLSYLRAADPQLMMERWTHHDLRRTARSLMSRAGCDADHSERALGHVIGGVRGIYDRHAFKQEKARVFDALAAQIERILNPQGNAVLLRR
jgi:integrase